MLKQWELFPQIESDYAPITEPETMSCLKTIAWTLIASLVTAPALAQTIPQCVQPPPHDVDPRRSLFVTELDVLEQAFSLEDLLTHLAADFANPVVDAKFLWKQLWDTQNQAPGVGIGINCDDQLDAAGNPAINDFPIQCPRNEGGEIHANPFDPNLSSFYELIGLVNRLDAAPADGANCGEYRAIFARSGGSRNLIIFEAVLPNPNPGCGLDGCKDVAEFWERLSRINSPARRAAALRRFYLDGFPSRDIDAVMRAAHFNLGAGQIRTNQFMTGPEPQLWQLREFKLVQVCPIVGDCFPLVAPVTVKQNPFGELFDETSTEARVRDFQRHYLTQVENLAQGGIHDFFAVAPDRFNAGQSNSQGTENNYPSHFANSPHFRSALDTRLNQLGSSLSPIHLVRRSMANSCAGCHQLNNSGPASDLGSGIVWPPSLGFVHVSENQTDMINGSEHFAISPALEDVFIPRRERVFERYLDEVACDDCQTLSTSSVPPPPSPVIVLDESGETDVELSPDALRALDSELKAGLSADTLGGSRAVH